VDDRIKRFEAAGFLAVTRRHRDDRPRIRRDQILVRVAEGRVRSGPRSHVQPVVELRYHRGAGHVRAPGTEFWPTIAAVAAPNPTPVMNNQLDAMADAERGEAAFESCRRSREKIVNQAELTPVTAVGRPTRHRTRSTPVELGPIE
jgi:hypothetical protein